MGWIKRARDERRAEHRCKLPGLWRGDVGDQWVCDDCGKTWGIIGRSHPSHPHKRWGAACVLPPMSTKRPTSPFGP